MLETEFDVRLSLALGSHPQVWVHAYFYDLLFRTPITRVAGLSLPYLDILTRSEIILQSLDAKEEGQASSKAPAGPRISAFPGCDNLTGHQRESKGIR